MIDPLAVRAVGVLVEVAAACLRLTDRADRLLFAEFTKRVIVIDLTFKDQVQIDTINALRRSRALKLPDAIIVVAATVNQAVLLSRDDQLLRLHGAVAGAAVQSF